MSNELDACDKIIYLAGGCFWGVEAYFAGIYGVTDTEAGYANGNIENPTYKQVTTGTTGFAETVEVIYNPGVISLRDILLHYFNIIDPTAMNQQGNDKGTQYRTGIYYVDDEDKDIIKDVINHEAKNYTEPIVVEVKRLKNFYPAEEYHQKYLDKNPDGYCHIDLSKRDKTNDSN